MSVITVIRDDTGKLRGFSDKDERAYARFKKRIEGLGVGELFTLGTWFPRNGKFHRKHFAMIAQLFDAQEQFAEQEDLRMWLQVGAGHCKFAPGPNGRMVAIPESISYNKLDDAEFEEHHRKVKDFIRSERARTFLWPHLPDAQSYEMVEQLLAGYE